MRIGQKPVLHQVYSYVLGRSDLEHVLLPNNCLHTDPGILLLILPQEISHLSAHLLHLQRWQKRHHLCQLVARARS